MNNPTPRLRRALGITALGGVAFAMTSCDASVIDSVNAARARAAVVSSQNPRTPDDAKLARIRNCESHGNYAAVSRSGTFRGAYQFSRSTWNNSARAILPEFVGMDPAAAPDYIQDAMARYLYSQTGPRSWPVCGSR